MLAISEITEHNVLLWSKRILVHSRFGAAYSIWSWHLASYHRSLRPPPRVPILVIRPFNIMESGGVERDA